MRILFCSESFPLARAALVPRLPDDDLCACAEGALLDALDGVDVVVPLMSRIGEAVMDRGRFRLVQQFGAGLEGVDVPAARARGIWVANTPSSKTGNADSVAEHAVMLMLALLRQLPLAQANVRAGMLGAPIGRAIEGLTVCLLGLGAIAAALAARLRPFNVRLIGVSRRRDPVRDEALGLARWVDATSLPSALAETDVLVVCTPLTPETRGIVDARAFESLRPGACVVNVARGAVIDYAALYAALQSGRLAGAGLDVFWNEPIAPDDPLLQAPNLIVTPHVAGVTDRSYAGIAAAVVENIERLRRGEPPLHRVA